MLKTVAEVVAKLGDRGFAAGYVVQVNKGTAERPRLLDVIEWHQAVRMLDEVFGPFGWSAEIVSSHSSYAEGLYIVDLTLTGRAVDESGAVVELKRPGRGLGLVPRSALQSDAEHDRQAHGAKSDSITNATKALGDGFGLYLYQKKGNGTAAASNGSAPAAPAIQSDGTVKLAETPFPTTKAEGIGNASKPQVFRLREKGWSDDQIARLDVNTLRAVMDGIFGKDGAKVINPPAKTPDDFPF